MALHRNHKTEQGLFVKDEITAYPMNNSSNRKIDFSPKVVLLGFIIAVCSFFIFLLGVNIVIQYRTMGLNNKVGILRKFVGIIISIATMYALILLITWIIENWNIIRKPRSNQYYNLNNMSNTQNYN